ncbi:MAG: AAA family ATPase [Caldilineaceae bacterium]
MLKSLSIQNFRQFRNLNIEPLKRINLIAGKNNSGKTAVLEALYLLFVQGDKIQNFPSAFRNRHPSPKDDFENFWMWLPYQRDVKNLVQVSAEGEQSFSYTVQLESASNKDVLSFNYQNSNGQLFVRKDGSIRPANLLSWPKVSIFSTAQSSPIEDAEHFNQIAAKRGGRQRLTELLQNVEPNLQELQYLKLGTQPLVYADVGMNDFIPITQLGQGFVRLLRIFSEALLSESKIILIDEIENGIGCRAQIDLWRGLAASAHQDDIQVFATTHSYECIQAAHEVFSAGEQYDFVLHRLERVDDGNVRVITYDQETLGASFDLNFEVR